MDMDIEAKLLELEPGCQGILFVEYGNIPSKDLSKLKVSEGVHVTVVFCQDVNKVRIEWRPRVAEVTHE